MPASCQYSNHRGNLVAPQRNAVRTMFKTNVGTIDRIVRGLIGLALIALTLSGTIGLWGWIGIIPLATATFSTCPLYGLIGLSTCPATKT